MPVIYEPKGKAREYSELACNLFTGCSSACKYCYCPSIVRKDLAEWSSNPTPRTNILKQLEGDCKKMNDMDKAKSLLFCFMSDPYQSDEAAFLTRQALLICEKYGLKNVNVLTKSGFRATNDFDILKRNNWKFGSTIIFRTETSRAEWEPGAPSIQSRYEAVKMAHNQGIFTWISIEPVIIPDESLKVMKDLIGYVDLWKVGKLNHFNDMESKIDWIDFYYKSRDMLKNEKVYWKNDLIKIVNLKTP